MSGCQIAGTWGSSLYLLSGNRITYIIANLDHIESSVLSHHIMRMTLMITYLLHYLIPSSNENRWENRQGIGS